MKATSQSPDPKQKKRVYYNNCLKIDKINRQCQLFSAALSTTGVLNWVFPNDSEQGRNDKDFYL